MIGIEEVFERLHTVAPRLRDRGVTHLAVFGSVARGETSEAGDLDILVKLDERRKTFDTLMDIRFVLEDLFPETNVDPVLEDALKPAVRDRILSEARDVA